MGTASRADAVSTWHRRRVRIYDREAPLGYLLLVPTLVILGIFLLYPFLFGIWLSITDSELGNLGNFIGLGNYRFELRNTDGVFYTAVVNTFLYTGVTTVFKLGLGLVMALLLNQVIPFRRFVRAALLLPYIIPTVLSYEAWRWMFDPTFSVVNWLLVHTHLAAYPGPNWLGVPANAMAALMIVNIWRGTPFYAISFLAGMQVIPVDLYEAARVDGATRWQQLTNITLPMLRPVLLVVLLLSTILTFADFQGPFVLTNGAPYNSTQLLSTQTNFPHWAFNTAVVATVSTIISLFCSVLAGYSLARLRYRGADTIGWGIFVTYLVPPTLLFLPLTFVIRELHLFNNLWALILTYPTFLIPFCTWMLMGFFKGIPRELEEAALVDGATRIQAMVRIAIPLALPGILAAALFAFTLSWNEFLYALIFMNDSLVKTIPVGVTQELIHGDEFFWGELMAAALLGSVPVAVLYSFFVDYFVAGMTAGAVKG